MKKYFLLIILSLFVHNIWGQTIWYADLEEVTETGYYNIEISQQLIGISKQGNLENMLILNADSIEVPYFIRSASPIEEVRSFQSYTLKKNITRDSLNIIIVDNYGKENISRFYLTIANADVKINVAIRGSENLKQWYTVKKRTSVFNYNTNTDNDGLLIIDFPQGDYKYYEITLSNDQKSPLHVKQVNKSESSNIYGQLEEIVPTQNYIIRNKGKKTEVTFPHLKSAYYIYKADFEIKNKVDFLRNGQFLDTISYNQRSFILSSKNDNSVFINNFLLNNDGIIAIENRDNPPLQIDSIKLYGLKRYACAYLEKGSKYIIQIDNERMSYPSYDIEHFKNDIQNNIPSIKTTSISSITKTKPIIQREQLIIEKPIVLWTIIIILGLALTIFCLKMLANMKKKEER